MFLCLFQARHGIKVPQLCTMQYTILSFAFANDWLEAGKAWIQSFENDQYMLIITKSHLNIICQIYTYKKGIKYYVIIVGFMLICETNIPIQLILLDNTSNIYVSLSSLRSCRPSGPTCLQRRAETWAFLATCCAAPATCSESSASLSSSLTADTAASRRLRWKHARQKRVKVQIVGRAPFAQNKRHKCNLIVQVFDVLTRGIHQKNPQSLTIDYSAVSENRLSLRPSPLGRFTECGGHFGRSNFQMCPPLQSSLPVQHLRLLRVLTKGSGPFGSCYAELMTITLGVC